MTYPIVVAVLAATGAAQIGRPAVSIPEAARAFVAAGTQPIAFETADLNRDGRPDAVLVLSPILKDDEDPFAERPRTLLILLRQADGSYREAARNSKVADKETTTISTPPKHFGKIDIGAFDPERWKNVGPR